MKKRTEKRPKARKAKIRRRTQTDVNQLASRLVALTIAQSEPPSKP